MARFRETVLAGKWLGFLLVHAFSTIENFAQKQMAADADGTRGEEPTRKKELVEKGHAHGILVYANGQPVGWCQYRPQEELPRIDNKRSYRSLPFEDSAKKLWRIPCFVVDKKHR